VRTPIPFVRSSAQSATDGPLPAEADALAGLRQALLERDPVAFADCFSDDGWIRVPRPDGDMTFVGRDEIAQVGNELHTMISELSWIPSQRFVAAGQVVEEAVVRARTVAGPAPGGSRAASREPSPAPAQDEVRFSLRVVAELALDGGIGSLSVWVDWAALRDPLGVQSANGAASALVALARSRDDRGLRVIRSTADLSLITAPTVLAANVDPGHSNRDPGRAAPAHPGQPEPPGAAAVWWRQHRNTLAGSGMAILAALVLTWVTLTVLRPTAVETGTASGVADPSSASASASSSTSQPFPGTGAAAGAGTGSGGQAIRITAQKPGVTPTVQPGKAYTIRSDVLFEFGSPRLSPRARTQLEAVVRQIIEQQVRGNIQINGFTDDVGTAGSNLVLSKRRASAVAHALQPELAGLPVQLSWQGFGETRNVRPNTTPAGRSQNRRVTVVLPANPAR
jgi:outer membrane protein OmpA-like peptidoglycan-associated protein